MNPKTRRVVVPLVSIGVLAAVTGGAWWFLVPPAAGQVAMPPDDASPVDVVHAYLAALDAHDCDTAQALGTPDFSSTATMWCDDLKSLDVLDVGEAIPEDPALRGLPASAELVMVTTEIAIDWRWLHDDPSMLEGEYGWSYLLVRDDGPWRITDNGQG